MAPPARAATTAGEQPASRASAGLQLRIVAFILDVMVLIAFGMLFAAAVLALLVIDADNGNPSDRAFLISGAILALYLVAFVPLYHILLWSWRGQTVGMMAVHIRVLSSNGGRVSLWRSALRFFGRALSVLLTLFFVAISAVQLSSEGTGQRLLRRSVAVSTQIDAVLPDLQIALRERAREGSGETVRVPDFPVPVDLTREEALRLEGPALRERILSEASDRLYEDGMSDWADPDARQSIET